MQGLVTDSDTKSQTVKAHLVDGTDNACSYDMLVICPGVKNGFWRDNSIGILNRIQEDIDQKALRFAEAKTIAVLGGGASGDTKL